MRHGNRTVRFRGRIITVTVDEVLFPNGHRSELEVVHHPGVGATVAIDAEERVCLLRQYRHAMGEWLWELPAGKLESGESPLITGKRELVEEGGVNARCWQSLGSCLSSPGTLTEVLHLFLATDLEPAGIAHEPGEVIEVHWVQLAEAHEWALNGKICDSKTAIGLIRAMHAWHSTRTAS